MACFLAKEQGRNRVYVSRENDEQLARHRSQMEWRSRLRDALLEGRLFLDAQLISPAVAPSLAEGERLRYEVLVRLRDEQGEVVPPRSEERRVGKEKGRKRESTTALQMSEA